MPLVKNSDTRFETQNENSINKVNKGAILSQVIHYLFKFVCYSLRDLVQFFNKSYTLLIIIKCS